MLLEASPEPLVSPLEDELLYADTFEKRQDVIKILSTTKKNVFLYICLFLVELLEHKHSNRCDSGRLGKNTIYVNLKKTVFKLMRV